MTQALAVSPYISSMRQGVASRNECPDTHLEVSSKSIRGGPANLTKFTKCAVEKKFSLTLLGPLVLKIKLAKTDSQEKNIQIYAI